jgi:hypothetical protein
MVFAVIVSAAPDFAGHAATVANFAIVQFPRSSSQPQR